MKILLHICCGPCAAFPVSVLGQEGIEVQGFFFNPNIHPFKEFQRRLGALEELAARTGLAVDYVREYGLRDYLRQVVFHEDERCALCYEMRLDATAVRAKAVGADAFSSTLLYSRYQKHELIRATAEAVARRRQVPFFYRDFRDGWQAGIEMAVAMELYRQPYCGCIYSEQERYDKTWRKGLTREK